MVLQQKNNTEHVSNKQLIDFDIDLEDFFGKENNEKIKNGKRKKLKEKTEYNLGDNLAHEYIPTLEKQKFSDTSINSVLQLRKQKEGRKLKKEQVEKHPEYIPKYGEIVPKIRENLLTILTEKPHKQPQLTKTFVPSKQKQTPKNEISQKFNPSLNQLKTSYLDTQQYTFTTPDILEKTQNYRKAMGEHMQQTLGLLFEDEQFLNDLHLSA